jgi:hypothetical protein
MPSRVLGWGALLAVALIGAGSAGAAPAEQPEPEAGAAAPSGQGPAPETEPPRRPRLPGEGDLSLPAGEKRERARDCCSMEHGKRP